MCCKCTETSLVRFAVATTITTSKINVGNELLKVEYESSLESMMSSPSPFVQRLESSQFAPQTQVKSSQFTADSCRVSTNLESTRPINMLKI